MLIITNKNKPKNLKLNGMMYFVHSYAFYPKNESQVVAKIKYGNHDIPAIVMNKNILGCQFHPEKSGSNGFILLKWFCKYF